MMLIRNSLLSLIRSKGKTALFSLLIFALTLMLSLGVCVWASIQQFLNEADEFYTTIGLVEYIGDGYPNDMLIDEMMVEDLTQLDISGIENDPATILWDGSARYFGYVDDFWRDDNFMADQSSSLIVVSSVRYNKTYGKYTAFVTEVLNSYQLEVDDEILLDLDFGNFKEDRYYVLFGGTYADWRPFTYFQPLDYSSPAALETGISLPSALDITVETGNGVSYEIPEVFINAGKTMDVDKNFVLVNSTDNLLAMYPFHQEELYIVEGRAFTDEEYASGERVIVISDLMGARLGKSIGDEIALSFFPHDESGSAPYYWAGNGVPYQDSFKIVGMTNSVESQEWQVFIPKAVGAPSSVAPIGYTVGQVVVQNAEAAAFTARVDPLLEGRFLLTMYDQGYANVAAPFATILTIAKILTVICAFVELAVLIFFGYLFVYRQRDTGETLLMLGAGKPWVSGYFLLSAGVIALFATLIGAVIGFELHGRILQLVAEAAKSQSLIDSRYSNGNLSITRVLEFAPQLEITFFLKFGLVVFAVALLSCLVFLSSAFKVNQMKRRKSSGPQKEGKTSHLRGGGRKYAILSILRGGTRTAVVPLLAVAVVFFLGQLATNSTDYHDQLEEIYDNTTISGRFTDIHGKQIGGQVIDALQVMSLYQSGVIDTPAVTWDYQVVYTEVVIRADGTEEVVEAPTESRKTISVSVGNSVQTVTGLFIDLIATNDFRAVPELYYLDNVEVSFLDGYDESFLTVPSDNPDLNECIVSNNMLKALGINLGDAIRVAPLTSAFGTEPWITGTRNQFDLLIVGSYEQRGNQEIAYIPLPLMFDTTLTLDEGQNTVESPTDTYSADYSPNQEQNTGLEGLTFNSATFQLSDSRKLSDLKDYMSEVGFSQVNDIGRLRIFIVVDDAIFNNAVAGVKQQIRYTNTLYPFLYALVGVIAFVVSYLLVVSRRMELAVLRGLGATSLTTFMSFFMEQSLLCLLGVGLGLGAWGLLRGGFIPLHLWLVLGFVGCYFIGSGLSIAIMNQRNLLTILSDKD
jgi:ABC-type lipoprotein release transport system permease subunit